MKAFCDAEANDAFRFVSRGVNTLCATANPQGLADVRRCIDMIYLKSSSVQSRFAYPTIQA